MLGRDRVNDSGIIDELCARNGRARGIKLGLVSNWRGDVGVCVGGHEKFDLARPESESRKRYDRTSGGARDDIKIDAGNRCARIALRRRGQ